MEMSIAIVSGKALVTLIENDSLSFPGALIGIGVAPTDNTLIGRSGFEPEIIRNKI